MPVRLQKKEAPHLVASHRTEWVVCLSPYLSLADCHMLTLLALFYFPPVLLLSPHAALPSGHSLELLTETGYVASPEKDKTDPYDRRQTENTFPNNSARASL